MEHIVFGRNVHIGSGTEIMAEGGVSIGNNVVISYHCVLWSINHRYEGDRLPYDKVRIRRPIIIHDNVWIGRNTIIRGGVTIGEGAVVAMGSVVTRDIPPLAVVGGNPALVLKFRDAKRYAKNKAEEKYLWRVEGVCGACQAPDFYLADAEDHTPSLLKKLGSNIRTKLRNARWRWFGM